MWVEYSRKHYEKHGYICFHKNRIFPGVKTNIVRMDSLVAPVENILFDSEIYLNGKVRIIVIDYT